MATVEVSEITLEYKGKKALAKLPSWEQGQESIEIYFGKKGRWTLEITADGVFSLHDDRTPDCIDSMTVKELIKLANKDEDFETPVPVVNNSVVQGEPKGTSTAF